MLCSLYVDLTIIDCNTVIFSLNTLERIVQEKKSTNTRGMEHTQASHGISPKTHSSMSHLLKNFHSHTALLHGPTMTKAHLQQTPR